MARLPYRYQLLGVRELQRFKDPAGNVRGLLAWVMGLGKSFGSLLHALRHPDQRPIIVVCPASIKWQWAHEVAVSLKERAEILWGRKRRKGKIKMIAPLVIVNYDILKDWLPWLKRLNAQLLIADEVHLVANRKSQRSKALKSLSLVVPHMLALSGTPLLNKAAELWAILNMLRPDLFPSFIPFAWTYCSPKRTPWGWDFSGSSNLDKLHKVLVNTVMNRILREDVIDQLPAKRRIVLPVDLKGRKEYVKASEDFMGWLAETAPGKLHGASKASGLVKVGYLKRLVARLKLPAVFEWIDDFLQESDGKLIVFAVHCKIVKALHERYAKTSVVVDGSVTGDHRRLAVRKFQTDSRCRIFIGNIQAAGVGLNLTAASTVLFAELGWRPGEHVQAEDRCFARIGDMHGADVYYIVGRDTIEQDLCKLIQKKQRVLDAVLDNGKPADDFSLFDRLIETLRKGTANDVLRVRRKSIASFV